MNQKEIMQLLTKLGVFPTYKGYRFLVYAIYLVVQDNHFLFSVSKNLYSKVADHFGTTVSMVEHDIRTLLRVYWNQDNVALFSSTIGFPVKDRLTAKEFIAIVADYLSSSVI